MGSSSSSLSKLEDASNRIEALLSSLSLSPESYKFMFPSNIEQHRFTSMINDGKFPTIPSLAPAITCCIVLSILRYILHVTLFKKLALYAMKLKDIIVSSDKVIDDHLPNRGKKIDNADIAKLVIILKSEKYNRDYISNYVWERYKKTVINKKVIKFVEALWRFIFYTVFSVIGYKTLFTPDTAIWVKDTKQHWDDWPLHPLTAAISLYYHVELGSYMHQLLWTEVNRKDTIEMMLHHLITISLIVTSYLTNYTRVGASILFLHDLADVFLESAKLFNYTSKAKGHGWAKNVCDVLFAIFAITFFITRLVIYPRYIIGSVLFEAPAFFGTDWIGYWVFAGLLIMLELLHIFWFYLIARMIYRLVTTGIEKDERSDDDDDIDLDDDSNKKSK